MSRTRTVLVGAALALALPPVGGSAAGAATLPVGRPVTIAWAGDTTLGSSHGDPPAHGWGVLAAVAPILQAADLTAVNSEGTFATGGTSKCGGPDSDTCFAFRAPPRSAATLRRAGVDVANLANNHAFDFGPVALAQTIDALRGQGIGVTGAPGQVLVRSVPGARVAFVGFSSYRWSAPLGDLAAVRSLVARARSRANVVVAVFHGGAEGAGNEHTPLGAERYLGEDRGALRRFAHAAVAAGADLVVGSGPHVLRGMELYRHRLIAYSLGNLAGWRNFGTGGTLSLSGILRVTVDANGSFLTGSFASLALDEDAVPHPDATRRAGALVSRLSREDFGLRGVRVARDGGLVAPPA